MRIVDAENADPLVRPEHERIAQFHPQGVGLRTIKIDIDDVLILLRRIFGILDRAVRTENEPFGMLLDPRVVRRALNGKVQSDLHFQFLRPTDERTEIVHRPQLRMDGLMAALLRTDRVGGTDIPRFANQRIVFTFAVCVTDRMDGKQVDDVKSHFLNFGQTGFTVFERPVHPRLGSLRAQIHFVPRAETGAFAVDEDFQFTVVTCRLLAVGPAIHRGQHAVA